VEDGLGDRESMVSNKMKFDKVKNSKKRPAGMAAGGTLRHRIVEH